MLLQSHLCCNHITFASVVSVRSLSSCRIGEDFKNVSHVLIGGGYPPIRRTTIANNNSCWALHTRHIQVW